MVIIPASVMGSLRRPTVALISLRRRGMYTFTNERYYLMSGETLEDYFRSLSLDETRRKYLEDIEEANSRRFISLSPVFSSSLLAACIVSSYLYSFHRSPFHQYYRPSGNYGHSFWRTSLLCLLFHL